MTIQIRTGKIELAKFLYDMNIPDFLSPICRRYGHDCETARHLLFHCEKLREERERLKERGRLDRRNLLTTGKGLGKATAWMMRNAGIEQFRLANTLLYGEEKGG